MNLIPLKWRNSGTKPVIYTSKMQKAEKTFLNALTQTWRSMTSRGGFGKSPDGNRDYNATFGYPEFVSFQFLYDMYLRGDIANTVVAKVAKACWRDDPQLFLDDKQVNEDVINDLKKAGAFKALENADILNRIGSFSVLVVGIADGLKLDQPLGTANNMDDVFFKAYSEEGVEFLSWDTEPTSKRYGLPILYQVRTVNMGDKQKEVMYTSRVVHWSRIIHLAEGGLDSEIEGVSALMPVVNSLLNKNKVSGSSSEAFYRNARRVFALEADKDANIDMSTEGKQAFKDEIGDFNDGYQDFMRLQGMKANVMQPGLNSPRDAFDINVEEVSGQSGIPIRILTGKGGGKTTGLEDRASWNSLVSDRSDSECTGWFQRMIDIFTEAGLIKIDENAVIKWPAQKALSELEESEVAKNKGQAFAHVAAGLSSMAGDNTESESVYETVGLNGVEVLKETLSDDEGEE